MYYYTFRDEDRDLIAFTADKNMARMYEKLRSVKKRKEELFSDEIAMYAERELYYETIYDGNSSYLIPMTVREISDFTSVFDCIITDTQMTQEYMNDITNIKNKYMNSINRLCDAILDASNELNTLSLFCELFIKGDD